jgi:hypothetical protein
VKIKKMRKKKKKSFSTIEKEAKINNETQFPINFINKLNVE